MDAVKRSLLQTGGIPLTHQLMDAFRYELPGLLLEPLHHPIMDAFNRPQSTPPQGLPEGAKHMKSHGDISRLYGARSSVSWTVRVTWRTRVVMQHVDTPREHTGTLLFDGGTKVSEGSAIIVSMTM